MLKPFVVYRATCLVNGKVYFGVTSSTLRRRAQKHRWHAERGSKFRFHKALRKHGFSSFRWEEIARASSWEEACQLEIDAILKSGSRNPLVGYNDTDGGQGRYGNKASDSTRKKMSDAQRGRRFSDAHREKLRLAWGNRAPASVVTREKMSRSRLGRPMNFSAGALEKIAVNRGKPPVGKGEKRA